MAATMRMPQDRAELIGKRIAHDALKPEMEAQVEREKALQEMASTSVPCPHRRRTMKLRPDDPRRKQFIKVLRKAYKVIDRRDTDYVCTAIYDVRLDDDGSENELFDAGDVLTHWIRDALGCDCIDVGDWLHTQGVKRTLLTERSLRKYRKRWINHMIRYFGGKP